ncbi:hypothetical protein NDU88_001119 [Pleurodeles waltl]|uniref:Secreted protein n=1 Tax=Pleurodeles waltl TaxID=8319 RepID=A0AAV7TGZ0_PLEWA|nr:hypothetical protein NDU88_001119 [Pleurodeles waltl]
MFDHGRHVFLLALPIEPCARVPLMLSARDETRFRCFATRKVADFRFSLHLLSRYRVFPLIPGARPRELTQERRLVFRRVVCGKNGWKRGMREEKNMFINVNIEWTQGALMIAIFHQMT